MEHAQQLIDQAYAARKAGNQPQSLELYLTAVEALRPSNEPLRLAHTIRHVADIQRNSNLLEAAHANYAEALAIYRSQPTTSKLDLANTLRGYALLSQTTGDISKARELWTQARALYSEVNVQAGVEEADHHLATMAVAQ